MKPNFTRAMLLLAVCLSLHTFSSFSQCLPAPVVPVYSPLKIVINQGQTVTYAISNAVAGYFYEAVDSTSGLALGPGVWAIANGALTIVTDPFIFGGAYTIYIKATYLLGPTQCTVISAYGNVIVNPSILPLQLIQFKGKKQGTGILLEWETANEDRLSRFEIERSETGSLFDDIGQVAATAQNNSGQHYAFTDGRPLSSTNYYRLKMIDQDGKFSYSNIVFFKSSGSLTASVMPNPFTKAIILQVALERSQMVYVRLINSSGAIITTKDVQGRQGNNTILFNDLSPLPEGTYFIQISNGMDMIQQKMLKINR